MMFDPKKRDLLFKQYMENLKCGVRSNKSDKSSKEEFIQLLKDKGKIRIGDSWRHVIILLF